MTVLCSVGTTHPWNIAGIGLDGRVCAVRGARQVAVVAAVSAQGGPAVEVGPLDSTLILAQFAALRAAGIDAYRLGALGSVAAADATGYVLRAVKVPVICDPVLATSGGARLSGPATVDALRARVFPVCTLVTPNLDEAEELCGFVVRDPVAMERAARELVARTGAQAVLIKGGHLEREASDVLFAGGRVTVFEGERMPHGMRGTGCVLATVLALECARGASLGDAVATARAFTREAIARARVWNGERVFQE